VDLSRAQTELAAVYREKAKVGALEGKAAPLDLLLRLAGAACGEAAAPWHAGRSLPPSDHSADACRGARRTTPRCLRARLPQALEDLIAAQKAREGALALAAEAKANFDAQTEEVRKGGREHGDKRQQAQGAPLPRILQSWSCQVLRPSLSDPWSMRAAAALVGVAG
jgi:hypothetical protein